MIAERIKKHTHFSPMKKLWFLISPSPPDWITKIPPRKGWCLKMKVNNSLLFSLKHPHRQRKERWYSSSPHIIPSYLLHMRQCAFGRTIFSTEIWSNVPPWRNWKMYFIQTEIASLGIAISLINYHEKLTVLGVY